MDEMPLGRFCSRKSDFKREERTIAATKMYFNKNQRLFQIRWEGYMFKSRRKGAEKTKTLYVPEEEINMESQRCQTPQGTGKCSSLSGLRNPFLPMEELEPYGEQIYIEGRLREFNKSLPSIHIASRNKTTGGQWYI